MNGGAFEDTNDTLEIHAPNWLAHETVTARYIPTAEDEAWVHNQLIKYQTDRDRTNRSLQRNKATAMENHTGEAKLLWVERMIVSWSFTRNGQPIAVSRASVRAMKLSYVDHIYDEIMKHQEPFGQSEEEAENFTPPASITTEAHMESEDLVETPAKASRNYLSKS